MGLPATLGPAGPQDHDPQTSRQDSTSSRGPGASTPISFQTALVERI